MPTKTKLVLAWIDRDGFELTGRYRDALGQHPETRATLQAKAASWGENTRDLKARLLGHIAVESREHLWMGWFELPYNDDMLARARQLAMITYKAQIKPAVTKEKEAAAR